MANYLPVLLVSVTAGMPDDAALQPLPRGQVDYLSHDWAEEDVWRSWRSMTKQKHEIANGVRLENASWRTWMKQRNNLKTVSPETLNWLKDSDVTWLYGPLHTAVDWSPAPKPAFSPPAQQQAKDDISAPASKSGGTSSLSSPSSTLDLDHLNQSNGRYGIPPQHEAAAKKPILKHRSIAEMLTSALPPAPAWAEESGEYPADNNVKHYDITYGHDFSSQRDGRDFSSVGRGGRPPLLHTKSDTHVLPRFGRGGAPNTRLSPPRPPAADYDSGANTQEYSNSLSAIQRTGASNNLAEMMLNARNTAVSPQSSMSPYTSAVPLDNTESGGTSTNDLTSTGRADSEGGAVPHAPALVPQKKHISFNAIVEQCIAIDGNSAPLSPSARGQSWSSYDDDGYAEDIEDGLYEDVDQVNVGNSDSGDDSQVEAEDEVIEIRPSSRRLSPSNQESYRPALEDHQLHSSQALASRYPKRPPFRRSSTGSSKLSRSRHSASVGSGSGSSSGRTSETGRSRSNVALDREHVSIAPIAPTILKTEGVEDNDDGVLYIGGSPYSTYGTSSGIVYGSGPHYTHRGSSGGGIYGGPSGYGYGYGGYGFGEQVSEGRNDVFEHYERGAEAGELVYQSPNGNIYPWGEGDTIRFRMQTEYGELGSPSRLYGYGSRQRSPSRRMGIPPSSPGPRFAHGPIVDEPSSDGLANEADFADFDDISGSSCRNKLVSRTRVHEYKGEINSPQVRDASLSRLEDQGEEGSNVRIAIAPSTVGTDVTEHSSPHSGLELLRDRTPSPDFPPKVNPRIASLKYESGCRSPSPSSSTSDIASTLVPSSPTLAIPTPGISPAHEEDYTRMRSPPDSPILNSGLLSPPDMSPRGRSVCASPLSGSATSSSIVRSGSRSESESRSDSRGRSRTRNSSLASSPDQGEPERGRSRSRSSASGASSPLGGNSPQTRYPPIAIGGIGIGLGIGGNLGASHSGREVRDGRGVRLYRKTSEDYIGRGSSSEGRSTNSSRGRTREGKRISESLSPPFVGSGSSEGSVISPPSGVYRSIPASNQSHHSGRTLEHESSTDSHRQGCDRDSLSRNAPNVKQGEDSPSGPPPASSRRIVLPTNSTSLAGATSSVTTTNGRILPLCIPEEDEQHVRWPAETNDRTSTDNATTNPIPTRSQPKAVVSVDNWPSEQRIGSVVPSQTTSGRTSGKDTLNNTEDGSSKTIADRSGGFVSSARTLLGTIWNAA